MANKTLQLFILFIVTIVTSCAAEYTREQALEDIRKEKMSKITQDSLKEASYQEYIDRQNRIGDSIKAAKEAADSLKFGDHNIVQKLTAIAESNPANKFRITTQFGDIKIKLYDDTPLHRANFIHLVETGFMKNQLFYRVIKNFVIQGGMSDRAFVPGEGGSLGSYTIPPEIRPNHFHKRGAVAMAVSEQLDVPKEKRHNRSSHVNFYIVHNGPLTEGYLKGTEKKYKISIPDNRREVYKKQGGLPHLDGDYTVFGEVYSGMSVVDKIAKQPTDDHDFPLKDIILSVEIIE